MYYLIAGSKVILVSSTVSELLRIKMELAGEGYNVLICKRIV